MIVNQCIAKHTGKKMKFVNLDKKILNKMWHIKDMAIWCYLASKNEPLSLEDIKNHYSLSVKRVKKALDELMNINAVEKIEINGEVLYQANKDTYFHSDD
jgi:predicted transcriptional regulator